MSGSSLPTRFNCSVYPGRCWHVSYNYLGVLWFYIFIIPLIIPPNTPKYPQMQANIKGLLRTIKVLIFLDNKGFNEYYWILLELEVAEPGPERICKRSTVSEDCWHVSLPNGSSRLVLLERLSQLFKALYFQNPPRQVHEYQSLKCFNTSTFIV